MAGLADPGDPYRVSCCLVLALAATTVAARRALGPPTIAFPTVVSQHGNAGAARWVFASGLTAVAAYRWTYCGGRPHALAVAEAVFTTLTAWLPLDELHNLARLSAHKPSRADRCHTLTSFTMMFCFMCSETYNDKACKKWTTLYFNILAAVAAAYVATTVYARVFVRPRSRAERTRAEQLIGAAQWATGLVWVVPKLLGWA